MKTISIECTGADDVEYGQLCNTQGDLKSLSKENYKKLKKVILELGFSEPLSVWNNQGVLQVINGHQRLAVIKEMVEKEGYTCPPLPISYVDAKSMEEAKRKVLALTSQYGKIETQGLYEFLADTDIAPNMLNESYTFPEVDLDGFVDEYYKEGSSESQDAIEDDIPEPKESNVKLGDI